MINSRSFAIKILLKIEKDGAYSNLALNKYLSEENLTVQDKSFVTTLVYGVLERKITLEYILKKFIKTPLKKVAPYTLATLEIALYQILYMDKVPNSAAVDEAVKCIKKSKESRNSGFVNGVLRNVLRAEDLLPNDDSSDSLSIIYSCPKPIIESFIKDYGKEECINLLKESIKPAPLCVKINTLKVSVDDFKNRIGVETESTSIENALILKQGINIGTNKSYIDGEFYVQDLASQTVIKVLSPQEGTRHLDLCAAPGGKSFAAAISMQNMGEIVACDLYEHKCSLIEKSASRLGLEIIKPIIGDASVFNEKLGLFDTVLCDVPCSGLGIIRRKPEIKYKDFQEFSNLPMLQLKILENAKKYLKQGGKLLYSTCTLRKIENEDIIKRFLELNSNFNLEYMHSFMPHKDGTDGFFCALLSNK